MTQQWSQQHWSQPALSQWPSRMVSGASLWMIKPVLNSNPNPDPCPCSRPSAPPDSNTVDKWRFRRPGSEASSSPVRSGRQAGAGRGSIQQDGQENTGTIKWSVTPCAKVCGDFRLLINYSYLPVGLISAATLLSASFTASLPSTPSVRLLCYEYLSYSIITANQQLTISNLWSFWRCYWTNTFPMFQSNWSNCVGRHRLVGLLDCLHRTL